jgi:hypothetical protein
MVAVADPDGLGRPHRSVPSLGDLTCMSLRRALIWGVVGGILFGLAMLAVGTSPEDRNPPYGSVSYIMQVWGLIHWPVFFILGRMRVFYDMRSFYQVVAVFVGYWTCVGVAVAMLVWVVRTRRTRRRRVYVT